MKRILLTLLLLLFTISYASAITSYNAHGQKIGSYKKHGSTIIQYDRNGQRTGSLKRTSSGYNTYNSHGQK